MYISTLSMDCSLRYIFDTQMYTCTCVYWHDYRIVLISHVSPYMEAFPQPSCVHMYMYNSYPEEV